MAETTVADTALLNGPKAAKSPASPLIVQVARKHGVSPFRQMREMFSLKRGPGKIDAPEYYAFNLYDPEIPMSEKRTFVGEKGSFHLNKALSPADFTRIRAFLRDKVMYTELIRQLGFRTTETQAAASPIRKFGAIPALNDAAAVEMFLRCDARYPVFAKPCEGSGSIGSALIKGVDGDDLVLGNGSKTSIAAFCDEVFRDYPDGFVFQTALVQHDHLTRIAGPAVGSVRVVTVRRSDDPELLYTLWKLPSPSAMSDNFWQAGSMLALVDSACGQILACHAGTGLDRKQVDAHPTTDEPIIGQKIPFWEETCEMARDAHALFPEIGLVGWDIAITAEGPAIIECNCNPHHVLYQLASGKGIRNAELLGVLQETEAKSNALRLERLNLQKARKISKRRKS